MNDPRFPGARRTREFLRQTEQGVPLPKRNMGREIFPNTLSNTAAFYIGPQAVHAEPYPALAAGFLNKDVSEWHKTNLNTQSQEFWNELKIVS